MVLFGKRWYLWYPAIVAAVVTGVASCRGGEQIEDAFVSNLQLWHGRSRAPFPE
jgi:hypothetical protein